MYRLCEFCGSILAEGFTNGDECVCKEHFEQYMDEEYEEWRQNDHENTENWDGGYYDFKYGDEWYDTGFYWTEWQEPCMNDMYLGNIMRGMAYADFTLEMVMHDFGDSSVKELLDHFADLIDLQYRKADWQS